ncbi:MAG: LTA synthase family protein [Saccharofermentanales bacterium]
MKRSSGQAIRDNGNSHWMIPAYICMSIVFMELILKINIDGVIWGIGVLFSFLFSVSSGLGTFFLISFARDRSRKILTGVLLGVLTVLFLSQFIYYEVFQTYYTIFSAANGVQVAQFFLDILYVMAINIHWLLIMAIPFAAYFFIPARLRTGPAYRLRDSLAFLLGAIIAFCGAVIPISLGSQEPNSSYDLYYKNTYPIYSVMNLGLLTTMRLDLQRNILGFEADDGLHGIDITPAPTSGSVSSGSGTSDPDPSPTAAPASGYNVMEIDFSSLAGKTTDKTLQNMHTYFSTVLPTNKNDHTGIFKGYNLILITAESFSQYAVNKDVTPTLYKMSQEGFRFTDFYTPLWGVSTSDGEYVATTGLIPKSGVWSMLKSATNYLPFTMGNQHLGLGCSTYAYHDHYFDYYGRDKSHPNLGYTYKGVGNGLKMEKQWPRSDLEMMQKTIPEYIGDGKFHTYYMTVSGHLSYNFFGNQMAIKNKALVDDLPYSEHARAYLSGQIELDRAMQYLLEQLDKAGIAEHTLIALSADHYPYGLKKADIESLAGRPITNNFELYRNSFLLYVKGMEPVTIDKPVSSLDILPTLSNLLGLEYDSRLLMGTDVFSDAPPLVIFNDKSFISEKGRYDALIKKFTPNPGAAGDEAYVAGMMDTIEKKFYYSAKILEEDYYRVVVDK